jgi:hypothetical protein
LRGEVELRDDLEARVARLASNSASDASFSSATRSAFDARPSDAARSAFDARRSGAVPRTCL